jgi:hypothetical protein
MKKIWKKCFRQKNQLFLLLLLTVIQCKQRYIRISLPCNVTVVDLIVIYIISGIKAILQDSSVKIADDEGVSPSSSVTHEFPVICFSPRVMYNILSTAANY